MKFSRDQNQGKSFGAKSDEYGKCGRNTFLTIKLFKK